MADRFANRVAVVTGGVSGIGLAIARRLAAEGARLAIWDRDRAALDDAAARIGAPVHADCLDLVDPAAVMAAGVSTAAALGRIDILVACAGITGPNGPVWEYPIADWQRVMDVNVNGVFYSNRSVVPHMLAGGWGRIVNIASVAGKEGNPNASAYSASKAGVIGLTKSLGKELAKTGVLVNCVAPAVVKTELFSQMTEQHINYMLSKIPMNRFGEVEEVAEMVAWLASSHCTFATGAVFDLSGGRATY